MIKVGIIGPSDSLDVIRAVARDFHKKCTFIEYVYGRFDELNNLKDFSNDVDALLFSGQAPYFWVSERENIEKPMTYIPRNGTCLYRTFFDIFKKKQSFAHLSCDTVSKRDVVEVLEDLNISAEEVNSLEYKSLKSYKEIIDFHLQNYSSNNLTIAITCLNGVYQALIQQKIPTYRVFPTKSIIRTYLEKAVLLAENTLIKEGQIALIIIRAEDHRKTPVGYFNYNLQQKLLDLHQTLLSLSEEIQATTLKTGDNEFMLVATRGSLDSAQTSFSLLQNIKSSTPLSVFIGIGFGKTARLAEKNARTALHFSYENKGECFFIVNDDGNVMSPVIESNKKVNNLNELAKNLDISVESLSNFKMALRRIGKNEITPKELSEALNLSERSARRILSHLEINGAAEIIGNQSLYNKGRPRHIYRILI